MVTHLQGEIGSMKFNASCEYDIANSILPNTATEGLPASKEHAIKSFPFVSDLSNKRNFDEYYGFRAEGDRLGHCAQRQLRLGAVGN